MTHINDNYPPTLGDENMDTREELTMKHSLDAPISTWKIPPKLYHDGYDYLSFYHPKFDDSTQILGLTDTIIDNLQANEDRLTVHLYEDARINSLDITKGTHYVNKGAYVGHSLVANSVLYIAGHIGELIVASDAQVFLYDTAYIDNLTVLRGGYVCAYAGASIYNMKVEEDGRCILSDKTRIHCKLYASGTISRLCEEVIPAKYRVEFRMKKEHIIPFCKKLTQQERSEYGCFVFGDVKMYGISGCKVEALYMDTDPDKDDYLVSFYAKLVTPFIDGVEGEILQSDLCKDKGMRLTILIDGKTAFAYFLEEKQQRDKDALDPYPDPYEGESLGEYIDRYCKEQHTHSVPDNLIKAYKEKPRAKAPWDDGKYASDWDMPPIGAPVHDEEAWDEYHKKREQEKEQKKAAWMKEKRVEVTGPLAHPYPPTEFTSEDYMDSYPDIMIHRTEKKVSNTIPASKIIDLDAYRKEQQEKQRRRAADEDDTDCTGSPYNT